MSFTEYIFCPLCGEHEWSADKSYHELYVYRCSSCKSFTYTMSIKESRTDCGLKIFYRELHEEDVKLPPDYMIRINYTDQKTTITGIEGWPTLLELNSVPKFNWYDSHEELIERIKKFLVFS